MRQRLVLVALGTSSMVVIAFLIPLAVLVRTLAAERAVRSAEVAAQSIAPALALESDLGVVEQFVESAHHRLTGTLTVFMPDGTTLGDAGQPDAHVAMAREGRSFVAVEDDGQEVYVPVILSGGDEIAVIRAFVPDEVVRRGVFAAWAGLAGLGAALILGATLVADRLGRSTVRAVRELESVAARLADGDLAARASSEEPPEVGRVAAALNLLAGRVVELLAAEREGAADLSHRLRTPLTALRLDAEALPDGEAGERIRAGVDALERAVDRVIRESRRPLREGVQARADLAEVVRGRVAFWAALAEEQGRRWRSDVDVESAPVPLSSEDAAAAVDALLGNVFAHTPEDAPFRVRLEDGVDGCVVVIVDDGGPGIPEGASARGVSGGRSTGLGLDIVSRTVELTGGSVTIGTSDLGGARVTARFGRFRPA